MKRPFDLAALLAGALLLSSACTATNDVVWPISKSAELDADPIGAPFGPRDQSGTYDFHAGVDLAYLHLTYMVGVTHAGADTSADHFAMTLTPSPSDFVPERIVLVDHAGDVIIDASR